MMKKLILLLITIMLCDCSFNKIVPAVSTVTTAVSETEPVIKETTVILSDIETTSFDAISSETIVSCTTTASGEGMTTTAPKTEKTSETTVSIKPIPLKTTDAQTACADDDVNPGNGFSPKNDIIINEKHYPPEFSGLLKKENDKYYCYDYSEERKIFSEGEKGGIQLKDRLFSESKYIYDIVSNYEPIGTAVYCEDIENDFETNMEELQGTEIYFFDEPYPENESNIGMTICALLIGTEPYIIVEGTPLYVYTTIYGGYLYQR